ncbi:Phospho-N-acetylmuramoyl-pentapeptide-transferase [Candidatus Norongarragalina meridionalis]|nr:Phospho-N-acetylmuramoyl-pentapeptide-transferase [Candidatus Norongarragalina meridionalis]
MGLPFVLGIVGVAALVAFFSATMLMRSAQWKKIVAHDDNKPKRPLVANMGGFAIYAGMASAILLGILFMTFLDANERISVFLLASLASITLLALIGAFDDLFNLSWRRKILLPIIGAFPLVAIMAGDTTMSMPFVGQVTLGWIYTFVLIPLGITGAANALNMTAGYNGVEAGIGAVMSFFLLIIAFFSGVLAAQIILAACLGACLAFLYFNWYPSRIFPADIGTLSIGAAIACAVIVGNIEKFGVICFIPAFYELGATVYYLFRNVDRRKACHSPVIAKDGRLSPPKGAENYTIFYRILAWKPMGEESLVKTVLALFAVCGCLAVASYFLGI